MSADLEITPLTLAPDTVDALSRILIEVVADGGSVSFLYPLSEAAAAEFWSASLAAADAGRRVVLGARLSDELIGTVTLDLATPQNQAHRADIAKLMTYPSRRGRGAARALMIEAELPEGRRDPRLRPHAARRAQRHDPLLEAAGARRRPLSIKINQLQRHGRACPGHP
jgi:GNAT superfamily N-acetyltransferase